jgi:PAS domain S-box-containing protein
VSKTGNAQKTKEQLIEELAEARTREEALRESEERYRSIVESIDIGLNLMDLDHNIIMVNAAQGRHFDKSPHEMTGKKCFREFERRDEVCPHCPGIEAIATGRLAEVEIYRVRDGIGRFMRLRAFPILRQDGTVSGFIEVAQDITARKAAEDALRESEERYKAFSDATTDGLLLHKDGITIDVNKSLLDMYGYDNPSELIGKNSIELTIPEPEDREKIYQSIKSGGTGPYEVMAKRADDGTTFPIEINARRISYKGEDIRVVLIRDITYRKQAEETMQQAYAQVEKQVEERTAELQREIAERERAQEENARLQQEIIETQKRALQELSTPIIPVMEHIIIMPLIGSVDTMRARDITRALLAGIRQHQAKVVILDITGVPIVDSGVAAYLNRTIQAARLKGARTIVTGISDAVAETIVDLGIDWSEIETLRDLRTGLRAAMFRVQQMGSVRQVSETN